MAKTGWLAKTIEKLTGTVEFETERLLLDVTEAIAERIIELGVKRSQVAEKMGVDKSTVTRLLSGDQNMTLRSLVGLASAVDANVQIRIEPNSVSVSAAADDFSATTWVESSVSLTQVAPSRVVSIERFLFKTTSTTTTAQNVTATEPVNLHGSFLLPAFVFDDLIEKAIAEGNVVRDQAAAVVSGGEGGVVVPRALLEQLRARFRAGELADSSEELAAIDDLLST